MIAVDSPIELDPRIADVLDPPPDPYAGDPAGWLRDKLGFVWSKQIEIAESVRDNRHTAVQSCHGPGKSWEAAGLVAWWLDVHPAGEAFAITTAPTQVQVEAILWREIGKHHRRAELDGYVTTGNQPQWKLPGGELIAFGRKPADYVDAEQAKAAFQGIHARYILVVIDEAAGIPVWLWEAIEGLTTNEDARVLAVGNPDDPASEFAKVCARGSGWNTIQISVFDTPNFTDEEVPEYLAQQLPSKTWVAERARRWGKKSNLWFSRVLGQFPKSGTDTLISPEWIKAAEARDLSAKAKATGRLGVDVARTGTDESTIYRNRGGMVRLEFAEAGMGDTMLLADEVYNRIEPHKGKLPAVIDVIGLGAGVYDRCAQQGLNVVPFNASERAYNPIKFTNRRSEQWWEVRELFRTGAVDIDPEDEDLVNQLGSIKWKVNPSGRVQVESKEDMAKRGVSSPDRGDALMHSTVSTVGTADYDTGSRTEKGEVTKSETADLMTAQW